MRLLFALAAMAVPFASSPAHTPTPDRAPSIDMSTVTPLGSGTLCRRNDLHPAESDVKGEMKRLDELPRGQLLLAVYREVNGCPEPVIVRRGYGFGADAPEAAPKAEPLVPPRPRARVW